MFVFAACCDHHICRVTERPKVSIKKGEEYGDCNKECKLHGDEYGLCVMAYCEDGHPIGWSSWNLELEVCGRHIVIHLY